jgi:hypothetical protein
MDDLKTTDNPTPGVTSQSSGAPANPLVGDETIPKPTPPESAPTAPLTTEPEKPTEPAPTIPTSTVTTQTTTTEPPSKTSIPLTSKPPGKKMPKAMKISGALIILLMAATLPATIILVQNKTFFAPKAEEISPNPTPAVRPGGAGKAFIALTPGEQESAQAEPIKPRNVEIKTVSLESVKITFSTQEAYPSLIRYSPDENWNYLTMIQEGDVGDEWQGRYHSENQVNVEPLGGSQASTTHEFLLENLIPGQKYYFVIEIEKTEENTVYLFGLGQPENYYTFITE